MEVVNTSTTINPVNMYDYVNSYFSNPIVITTVLLVIIAYFILSSSLGNSAPGAVNGSMDTGSSIMEFIVIAILVVLIAINAFQYFFSINITAYIQGLFTPKTTVDIVVDQSTYQSGAAPVPEIKSYKQVFNIPGNNYDYDNAKALCNAYGSDLATYDQIEKAYNNGAEWCNYGWSANQLALFPTQKQTYDNLQKIDGHQNDCGRTGVNGGYIANPKIKFGVNCYGYKPKITSEEDELMKTSSPYPETAKDIAFQQRIDYWKNKVDEILVSPFNHSSWGAL
jgi:hypothetical protein